MADYYIDYSTGDDTTGSGTSGSPWKTLQKAIDSASGGDTIHVANTAASVCSAQISWSSGWGGGAGFLTIQGWDNGGSLDITHPVADWTGVGVIDATGQAFNPLFSTTSQPNYVIFKRIKFTGYGNVGSSNAWIDLGSFAWVFVECEFYADRGTCYHAGYGHGSFFNCVFHNNSVNTSGLVSSNYNNNHTICYGCWFECDAYALYNCTNMIVINNVFVSSSTTSNPLVDNPSSSSRAVFFNNTFYSSAARTGPLFRDNNDHIYSQVFNNIFVGASGTGGVGLTRGNSPLLDGANLYYNNTTHKSGSTVAHNIQADVTGTDPAFTSAPDNLEVSSTSPAKEAGFPQGFPESSTTVKPHIGAVKPAAAAGGGSQLVNGGLVS